MFVPSKDINYSIIIPHYKVYELLDRALKSIPDRGDIQIIVVDDNSKIGLNDFQRLNHFKYAQCSFIISQKSIGAGGARNIGLSSASGKWLLFLDSDDFFHSSAFVIFDKYLNSDFDIVYCNTMSVFSNTLEKSFRFSLYKAYIECHDGTEENNNILKYGHNVPVAKMIKHSLVKDNDIKFDETRYCNDSMFAVKTAINSKKICVDKQVVYVVTEREGSLITHPTLEAVTIRYEVQLRVNKLIREKGMKQYQNSILSYLNQSLRFGAHAFFKFIKLGFRYSGFNIYSLYYARKRVIKIQKEVS